MPAETGTRAAVYVRVSTEDQVEGFGLDVQRQRCHAQALAKGWTVVGEYADEGISGTYGPDQRPGLAELQEAVEAGDVDAVIVLALDRLGRRTVVVLGLVERLNTAGADLVSCKESLDTSTPQGSFVLTMFAALAQLERDTIVERTTAGRNARGAIDGERGGRVPFGYVRLFDAETRKAEGIEVDQMAANTVRHIFRRRRQGATLTRIADELNADGIPTARGGTWHASSVAVVLDNGHAYAGGKRGASAVRWPAIIRPSSARDVAELDMRRAA